ncbi:MAG: diguanylate cyclase [Rubrivivax sp.]
MDDTRTLLQLALLGVLAPVWILAGAADWLCHRVQRIEASAGLRESALHLAMLAELGVAVLVALLAEASAAALALMLAACVAHELTTWADLAYAEARRGIPWYEQLVHGLQQVLPWAAFAGIVLLNADQALAALGRGHEAADWSLRWKAEPLPGGYLAAFFGASLLLVLAPFAAEFRRCWHTRPSR